MLASAPVRAPGERVGDLGAAFGAAAVCICALFFGGGASDAPLVWIGAAALVLAVLLLVELPLLDRPALLFVGGLFGLAVFSGVSVIWSTSPDRSWVYTNRTLVYAGFALAGVLIGTRVSREHLALGAAALLGLVAG